MYKLMIVDDEDIVCEGLKKFINWNSLGYEVVQVCNSVREVVDYLSTSSVHIILTDIMMPNETGLDLLKILNSDFPKIKCVILSGHEDFRFAQTALRLGASDYLTKPVNFNEIKSLFSHIKQLLDVEITEQIDSSPLPLHPNCIINNILIYIQEHYADELTLNTLSQVFYLHPTYLSKLFKEKTGENFLDYLTQIRIEKSKNLLANPILKIYDVSKLVGYDNARHFSKLFKNIVGVTPRTYKDNIFLTED